MKSLAATKAKSSPTTGRAPLLWRNTYTKRLVTFHAVRHPLGGQLPLHLLHGGFCSLLVDLCRPAEVHAARVLPGEELGGPGEEAAGAVGAGPGGRGVPLHGLEGGGRARVTWVQDCPRSVPRLYPESKASAR